MGVVSLDLLPSEGSFCRQERNHKMAMHVTDYGEIMGHFINDFTLWWNLIYSVTKLIT